MKKTLILDFMRTLYDPMTSALYPGVKAFLADMQAERRLILYSRQQRSRDGLIEELGIEECFEATYFVEAKTAANLRGILEKHGLSPHECIVVGDMIEAELSAGHELGAKTIWFNQGMFASVAAATASNVPDHTVGSISELHQLLRTLA